MKKGLKITGIVVVVLVALGYGAYTFMISQTKKASPEEIVNYTEGNASLEVFYNRPSKKGREIFGKLVPYGVTWRTGANEATTFDTNTDLVINGKTLPKGKYTLWTVPNADRWEVVFNNDMYGWGVNSGGAARDPEKDAMIVTVPVTSLNSPVELFTISFIENANGPSLQLAWDTTAVSVPFSVSN